MDANKVVAMRKEINAALEAIAAKYDVTMSAGPGRYDDHSVVYKLNVVERENGRERSIYETDFLRVCARYGMTPEHLGQEIQLRDGTYRIVGARTSARRYPIVCEHVTTGERIRVTAWTAKSQLA